MRPVKNRSMASRNEITAAIAATMVTVETCRPVLPADCERGAVVFVLPVLKPVRRGTLFDLAVARPTIACGVTVT